MEQVRQLDLSTLAQLIHRDSTDERMLKGPALSADWPPPSFDPPEWRR